MRKRLATGLVMVVVAAGALFVCNRDDGEKGPPAVTQEQQDS